ncbi:MAG TPA: type II toxin-antitoxin system VapC family toxin [Thermoanaerobaculia bacterium]|nr:type II toxin-antitoxin system VapC family toxin [Thermoanaerobaculia bacterium]
MILYLDTSSLVKLYVEENGSTETARLVGEALLVCTSVVAYAEARSALARLRRERKLSEKGHKVAKTALDEDWPRYLAVEATREVWRAAGDLAEKHALRGFDSLHLSSFLHLANGLGEPVHFSSFDERLNGAAQAETGEKLIRED